MWGETECPSLIFSKVDIFSCDFFFLMCELKVPVKISFVAVYPVMNSFWWHPPGDSRRSVVYLETLGPCECWMPLNMAFCWWAGLWLSLLFHLRPNYGGGNEDNGNLLQKILFPHCCTQCTQPFSRPPPTHTSVRDSWTLTGKPGSVSFGNIAPFSYLLVHTRFCLCPPRVCFPSSVAVL